MLIGPRPLYLDSTSKVDPRALRVLYYRLHRDQSPDTSALREDNSFFSDSNAGPRSETLIVSMLKPAVDQCFFSGGGHPCACRTSSSIQTVPQGSSPNRSVPAKTPPTLFN